MDAPLDAGVFAMTDRSLAFYPFPDDGSQTLHRVISRLPMEHRRAMTWRPTEDWLLEVSPNSAKALSGLFSHAGVHQLDPSWKAGALLVPDVVRAAAKGCSTPSRIAVGGLRSREWNSIPHWLD